jgi:hypothetical protein
MKNSILIFAAVLFSLAAKAQFNVCNVEIKEVSVSGPVSFGSDGLDTSEACIQLSGTADLCNDEGETIASGLTLTLASSGCNKSKSLEGNSVGSNELFIPFELLGEQPALAGEDVPIVYPNPSTDGFTLKTKRNLSTENVKVFDFNGNLIQTTISKSNDEGYKVNLPNAKSGNYFLQFVDGETKFSQQIIIK